MGMEITLFLVFLIAKFGDTNSAQMGAKFNSVGTV
jgi:hypothetical protein